MQLNILGTEYTITVDVDPMVDKDLTDRFGYCDTTMKNIVVADLSKIDDWKDETEQVRLAQRKATLRHEIIHGFFKESGLWGSSGAVDSWATNEEMVDWIALQSPKMFTAFQQADAL